MKNNQNKELVLLKDLGMQYATSKSKHKRRFGLYKCFCGNEFNTTTVSVKNGNTKSCGCVGKEKIRLQLVERMTTHGLRKHRLYDVWCGMMRRCYKHHYKRYKDYGGRGIIVHQEWHDIKTFIEDMYPSFQEGLSLDRENNNLGYSKENCRWANQNIQSRNTRILMKTNTSGYRGVSWHKKIKKFGAQITINNKIKHLGYFETAVDAAKVYDKYILDNILEHTRNFS